MKQDECAQVGIGTMIVFIATVLVAAVAAGVLINVSGDLQSQATSTGNAATENVASTLSVQSVYGDRECGGACSDTDDIDSLDIYVALGAGSDPVDLTALLVQIDDGSSLTTYKYDTDNAGAPDAGSEFDTTNERGSSETLLTTGGLNKLELTLPATAQWAEDTEISVQLIPEKGSPITVSFRTPTAYGEAQMQELF